MGQSRGFSRAALLPERWQEAELAVCEDIRAVGPAWGKVRQGPPCVHVEEPGRL